MKHVFKMLNNSNTNWWFLARNIPESIRDIARNYRELGFGTVCQTVGQIMESKFVFQKILTRGTYIFANKQFPAISLYLLVWGHVPYKP
jgi:hypothetical protein